MLSASVPFYMPKTTKNLSVCQEEDDDALEDAVTEVSNNHQSTTEEEARALLTAFPEILSSAAGEKIETKECTGPPPSKEYSDNAFQAFKQEYVQAAVEEAMDEFCTDMRKQLWHMHYDMIKAFQKQQLELQQSLREYAVNEALVEEVERLRAENAQLKKSPFVIASQTHADNSNK